MDFSHSYKMKEKKFVTLNEYMPREMRMMKNIFVVYYHVDKKKTLTVPIMKKSYDDSSNLSHGVYTIEISFKNIDLLLGSKLYN